LHALPLLVAHEDLGAFRADPRWRNDGAQPQEVAQVQALAIDLVTAGLHREFAQAAGRIRQRSFSGHQPCKHTSSATSCARCGRRTQRSTRP
jgi:hypothetical protein